MLPERNHDVPKGGKSILVVDDDENIAFTFKAHLDHYGFQSDVFNDPQTAISQFKKGKYALAILDIRMPEISGFELSKRLRKKDKEIKICFLTAFEEYYQSLKEQYPDLDVKCFMKKPISITELYKHIVRELA
jgi:DNA-binding response OmpR family regulator